MTTRSDRGHGVLGSAATGLLVAVLSLTLLLTGCGGSGSSNNTGNSSNVTSSDSGARSTKGSEGFDANSLYVGQWRGSVEITGQTVYGTAGGNEQMLDVTFKDDGSCEVTPLEAHADLLRAKGSWKGTESEVVLTLEGDKVITLTAAGKGQLKGKAADFGISDFDAINFDFYG